MTGLRRDCPSNDSPTVDFDRQRQLCITVCYKPRTIDSVLLISPVFACVVCCVFWSRVVFLLVFISALFLYFYGSIPTWNEVFQKLFSLVRGLEWPSLLLTLVGLSFSSTKVSACKSSTLPNYAPHVHKKYDQLYWSMMDASIYTCSFEWRVQLILKKFCNKENTLSAMPCA